MDKVNYGIVGGLITILLILVMWLMMSYSFSLGYKSGQYDGLNGVWEYEKINVQPDSLTPKYKYIEVDN